MVKKKWTWAVIGFLAVTLIAVTIMNNTGGNYPSASYSPRPSAVPKKTTYSSSSGTAQQTQTYSDLIKEYTGKVVQFDANCQASPNSSTYKNNSKVMFDNRSGEARTITIDGVKYSFAGYGYRIITLYSTKLPHTFPLHCGSAYNVGSVSIQK